MVINSTVESLSPRKTRRQLLSEWRRGEILQAARRLFAHLGYPATNVEDIAKEASMAKGTVYLYFKSKEEIFAAVLADDLEGLTNKTIEAMSAVETFPDRLTVFLNLRLEYLKHNQDFLKVYLAEFGSRGSRSSLISVVIDKLTRRGIEFMSRCLEQAVTRNEIRAIPAEAAALAIYDLARGFAERHLSGWADLTLEEDLAFTHSLIFNGLQKPGETS
jgi:AcrR family transcriptional regulator